MEADFREQALARRHILKQEQLSHNTKPLPPLATGDLVMIQDQAANKQPGKWTQTGRIIEVQKFDSYLIKIDGSRTVTKRNRKFLRRIVPFINAVAQPQPETNPEAPVVPVSTNTPTPTPNTTPTVGTTPIPSQTRTPKLTSRQPIKERWIVTKKSQTKETNTTVSAVPALPTTPTPIPSLIKPPEPTSGQPVRERWIVTKKPPTEVPVITTNNAKEHRDGAAPNNDDAVLPIVAPHDDNHANVMADATAATSVNTLTSTPIPLRITYKPPGTRHDYKETTRDAARARAEVTRGRI